MTAPQLFPKPPRRMKQPRKDAIRWRAELAEARLAFHTTPRWWRLAHRFWARIVEVDDQPETFVLRVPLAVRPKAGQS